MSKKYKEEINKIVMNDDMKKRILQNVLAANENESSSEKNIKVKTTIPKVKKYNNLKRNMKIIAASFSIVLCLSVAKNYPMLFNHASNDLEQKESEKSHDDENNDLKTSDDNEIVYNNGSEESSNNNNKKEQASAENNNNSNDSTTNNKSNSNKNADDNVNEKSNNSAQSGQEEKNKNNSQSDTSSKVEKNQSSQNNNDKSVENPQNSSETNPGGVVSTKENKNPEKEINNKENKSRVSTEPETKTGDTKQDKTPENNTNNNDSGPSTMMAEAQNYSQDYKTLDEAEKALSLKVDPLKTVPKGFKMDSISVISNEIIQVDYNNGTDNIIFRAGKGIDNISGDYNVYQVKSTNKVNGVNINLEGNKKEEYNLAVWEKDGISYSISAAEGIDEKTMLDMIR